MISDSLASRVAWLKPNFNLQDHDYCYFSVKHNIVVIFLCKKFILNNLSDQ